MTTDATNGIVISLLPVFLLLIGVFVYAAINRSKRSKEQQNIRQSDALIEAQAMLAQLKKENAAKENKETSENKTKEKSGTKKPEKTEKSDNKRKNAKDLLEPATNKNSDLEPDIDTKID